jgi:hypothetical protein
MMRIIEQLHGEVKKSYDTGGSPVKQILDLAILCIERLNRVDRADYQHGGGKSYFAFTDGRELSRPIRSDLFLDKPDDIVRVWNEMLEAINPDQMKCLLHENWINSVLYTAVIGFAACFDIWKKSSRKTPGTHFEVILGSLISQFLPDFVRTKFIRIPGQIESVSTDIVFGTDRGGIVIPAKITTRERIVQPFAHQRILDSVFPIGSYQSVLLCVSETQRDNKTGHVKDICVPGTIRLFQAHLSRLNAIYYLDPPSRYLQSDITDLLIVSDYGQFFREDLALLAMPLR